MGLNFFSSCSCDNHVTEKVRVIQTPNPNPKNFIILDTVQCGKNLVAKIKYPDCSNFEGIKILVFENTTEQNLRNCYSIDPHFCEYSRLIARFRPNQWKLAIEFATMLKAKHSKAYEELTERLK